MKYKQKTEKDRKKVLKSGFIFSLLFGISQMAQFIIYGIVFLVGAILVRDGKLTFDNLIVSQFAILFGAYGAGMAN